MSEQEVAGFLRGPDDLTSKEAWVEDLNSTEQPIS
jgi:hypothetical protein